MVSGPQAQGKKIALRPYGSAEGKREAYREDVVKAEFRH